MLGSINIHMSADAESDILGLAWYRPDQWAMLRALAPDGERLQPSHSEWLKEASTQLYEFEQRGLLVRKVDVDLPALLRWCEAQGLSPDSNARAAYVRACLGVRRT